MIIHVLGQYLDHKKCGRFLRFGATAAPLIVYNRYRRRRKISYLVVSDRGIKNSCPDRRRASTATILPHVPEGARTALAIMAQH